MLQFSPSSKNNDSRNQRLRQGVTPLTIAHNNPLTQVGLSIPTILTTANLKAFVPMVDDNGHLPWPLKEPRLLKVLVGCEN